MLVYGMARLGALMSILDFVHMGFFMLLQSSGRLGLALLVYGLTHLGLPLLASDSHTWEMAKHIISTLCLPRLSKGEKVC